MSCLKPSEGYQRLDDSERQALAGARLVGPADQAEALTVTVALRRKPGAPELPDEQYWADTAGRADLPVPGGLRRHACTGWGSLNGHELRHALRRRRDHR